MSVSGFSFVNEKLFREEIKAKATGNIIKDVLENYSK